MSCQLIPFSWFDVNVVKRLLFPDKFTDTSETHMGWPEDFKDESSTINSESDDSWLQECHICISPSREILLFANKAVVVIMTSKWESQTKNNVSRKYVLLWSGSLQQEAGEKITSVLCLPLASVGRSSHHGADWTCLVVGYSSGYVRFYTENGGLMVSEVFHEEPVLDLKSQSYRASNYPGELEYHEELLVKYRSAVVSLNGFALFQTLRGCRSHLARVKANCRETMKPPPLAYKKWGFTEQRIGADEFGVSDCEVVGLSTPHTFDHLHQHHITSSRFSSIGGFKPRAPATSLVVATGSHPFVGFHYSIEGGSRQVIYHDVARAVTDRLKETLSHTVSSWIFGVQNTEDKASDQKVTSEPASPLECRFGLCDDPLRKGNNVVMTQNRRLSAVTDNIGRIILIDNFKGMAVRLWKGYRDAECGWMDVYEEPLNLRKQLPPANMGKSHGSLFVNPSVDSTNCLRVAHFLIVHCPRPSILQVLSAQKGSKIATIPLTKGSRLLYINHGIVGTNNVPLKKKRGLIESPCIVIEPNGFLKDVVVPFHFALSEESSEKVRDFHLIIRLKKTLRNAGGRRGVSKRGNERDASEEIFSIIKELKGYESLILALLTMSTHPQTSESILLSAINIILQKLEIIVDKPQVPVLWSLCCQLRQLINLYAKASQSFEEMTVAKFGKKSDVEVGPNLEDEESMKILLRSLNLSGFEAKDLLKLMQLFRSSQCARRRSAAVSFEEQPWLPIVDFLSCFDLITSENHVGIISIDEVQIRKTSQTLPVALKLDLPEHNMGSLCQLLFYPCLISQNISSNWKYAIASSGISTKDLLTMLMYAWLQFGWQFLGDPIDEILTRLIANVKTVCSFTGSEDSGKGKVCIHSLLWWEDVQNMLSSWHSPFLALIGSLACRAVAINGKPCKSKCLLRLLEEGASEECQSSGDGTADVGEEGWEQVSVEGMAWDKLVRNLLDLAHLEAAVSWAWVKSSVNISLKMVTVKGRGCVSEMAAQWVLSCSTLLGSEYWSPSALVSFLQTSVDDDDSTEKEKSTASEALGLLRMLKFRFPFSLSPTALMANVCWECARNFASEDGCSAPVLKNTFSWLLSIPSSRIQRGLCGLLWTVHLEHHIKAGAQLLESYPFIDAIPERVVLDEVGLPSLAMLHDLFTNAYKFLDIMAEFTESIPGDEEVEMVRWEEELWGPPEKQVTQQYEGGASHHLPPLIELALLQPPLPPSLTLQRLTLYHQLCLVLCLTSRMHHKGPTSLSQPLSQLFTVEERASLLSSSDSGSHIKRERNAAPAVTTSRISFVKKSISAVCRSVDYDENSSKELIRLSFKVAELFGLPLDNIRRHHVCELYSCGHDREAEELMGAVVDKESLASQLLVIVFQRLKHYLEQPGDSDHRSEVVATFSPASLARFNNQSTHLVCKDSSMQSTEQLLSTLIAYLHEESSLYSEALGILDAVKVLASQE